MIEGIAGGAETAPDDAILENYLDSYDWYGTQSADTDSSAAYAGYHSNPDWSDSDDGHVDDDFSIYSGGSSDSGG